MRVIVIERFRDKYTKEIYEINRILTVSSKRYEEMKKYVKLFEERAKKSARRKG